APAPRGLPPRHLTVLPGLTAATRRSGRARAWSRPAQTAAGSSPCAFRPTRTAPPQNCRRGSGIRQSRARRARPSPASLRSLAGRLETALCWTGRSASVVYLESISHLKERIMIAFSRRGFLQESARKKLRVSSVQRKIAPHGPSGLQVDLLADAP